MITIDWDTYEVLEAEDYTDAELEDTIEDVREYIDLLRTDKMSVPDEALELLAELTALDDMEAEVVYNEE